MQGRDLQKQKEKRESAVTKLEDKGTQRATKGSTELSAVNPCRLRQSSAGTMQRDMQTDAEGVKRPFWYQENFGRG